MLSFIRFVINFSDDKKEIGFFAAARKHLKIFWDVLNDPRYNKDSFMD